MADEAQAVAVRLGALDMALIPCFFISYMVLLTIHLNNLFARRFMLFAGLAVAALVLALALGAAEFPGYCADANSVLICGDGRGLRALGLIWTAVAVAALGLFALSRGLSTLVRWRAE